MAVKERPEELEAIEGLKKLGNSHILKFRHKTRRWKIKSVNHEKVADCCDSPIFEGEEYLDIPYKKPEGGDGVHLRIHILCAKIMSGTYSDKYEEIRSRYME